MPPRRANSRSASFCISLGLMKRAVRAKRSLPWGLTACYNLYQHVLSRGNLNELCKTYLIVSMNCSAVHNKKIAVVQYNLQRIRLIRLWILALLWFTNGAILLWSEVHCCMCTKGECSDGRSKGLLAIIMILCILARTAGVWSVPHSHPYGSFHCIQLVEAHWTHQTPPYSPPQHACQPTSVSSKLWEWLKVLHQSSLSSALHHTCIKHPIEI